MLKNAIAPIQAWLMSQGRCVGCGKEISHGKASNKKGMELVTCTCGRVYLKDKKTGKFRRALLSEV